MAKFDNINDDTPANFKKADGFINLRAKTAKGVALKGNTVGIPLHKPADINKNDTATVLYRLAEAGRIDVLESMYAGFVVTINMVDENEASDEAISLDSFA